MQKKDFNPRLETTDKVQLCPCSECKYRSRCDVSMFDSMHAKCLSFSRIIYWTHDSTLVHAFLENAREIGGKFAAPIRFQMEVSKIKDKWIIGGKPVREFTVLIPEVIKEVYRYNTLKATNWEIIPTVNTQNIIEAMVWHTPNKYSSKEYRDLPEFTFYGIEVLMANKDGM